MSVAKTEDRVKRRGEFVIYKRPWDRLGPYGGKLRLRDGRAYTLRLRSHPTRDGRYWYEGFALAVDAQDYARDQELTRYPVRPVRAPRCWALWPCQVKLNPLPQAKRKVTSPDLMGEIWLSSPAGSPGGEVLRLFADYCRDAKVAFAGGAVSL